MNEAATPSAYIRKAERAISGARLLLSAADPDGACNRAYYAMFDAAQAALLAAGVEAPKTAKTHRGLIAAFGRHLVRSKRIAPRYGASFNQVERLRLLADYTGEPTSMKDAAWAIDQAAAFVGAIQSEFSIL